MQRAGLRRLQRKLQRVGEDEGITELAVRPLSDTRTGVLHEDDGLGDLACRAAPGFQPADHRARPCRVRARQVADGFAHASTIEGPLQVTPRPSLRAGRLRRV